MPGHDPTRSQRDIVEDLLRLGGYARAQRALRTEWVPLTNEEWRLALSWIPSTVMDEWHRLVTNAIGNDFDTGYEEWHREIVSPLWDILEQLAEHHVHPFEPLSIFRTETDRANQLDWASSFLRGLMFAGKSLDPGRPRGWSDRNIALLTELGLSPETLNAIRDRELPNGERDEYFGRCREYWRHDAAAAAASGVTVRTKAQRQYL